MIKIKRKRKEGTIYNEDGYGMIYSITNSENGMKYIGQTAKEYLSGRIGLHFVNARQGKNSPLYDDMRVSNKDIFKVDVIEHHILKEDLWDKEKEYIEQYDTIYPKGYNIAKGGGGTLGVIPWDKGIKRSEETKRKISEKFTNERKEIYRKRMAGENNPCYGVRKYGADNPNYGKHSKGMKLYGESNHFYGKHHSEQTKERLSEAQSVKKKPVSMYSLDGKERIKTFESLSSAAKYLKDVENFKNADDSFIGKCAKGKHKMAYGYKWIFKED